MNNFKIKSNFIEDDIINFIIDNAYNENRPLTKDEEKIYKLCLKRNNSILDKIMNKIKTTKKLNTKEQKDNVYNKILKQFEQQLKEWIYNR